MRRTQLLGNSQRKRKFKPCHQEEQEKPTIKEDEINPTIRKISKKREDQPCHHEEFSGQLCNREAPSFPTLSSRKIQLILVITRWDLKLA